MEKNVVKSEFTEYKNMIKISFTEYQTNNNIRILVNTLLVKDLAIIERSPDSDHLILTFLQ